MRLQRPVHALRSALLPCVAFVTFVACVERGDVLRDGAGGSAGAAAGVTGGAGSGGKSGGDGSGGTPSEPSGGDPSSAGSENGARASEVGIADNHACAIVGGVAHCWGNNDNGQLGLGDRSSRSEPTPLPGDRVWRHLALGRFHTCGLDDTGQVYCWGDNARGELGLGDRNERTVPTLVQELPTRATALSSSFEHTCAVLMDYRLYCWGKNDEGDLGQDDAYPGDGSTDADALLPIRVPGMDFQSADTGQGHTCAIALDGSLFCWGRNSRSELGTGSSADQLRTPTRVGTDTDWLEVDAGQQHSCARKRDLSIWCWGLNTGADNDGGYPLGIDGAGEVSRPTRVGIASDWTLLRTNTFHTCGLKQNSELWCWGRNVEGQLGLGDMENRPLPTSIGLDYADVSAGRFTTCALTHDGGVRCAGANDDGELGTADTQRRNVLTDITFDEP